MLREWARPLRECTLRACRLSPALPNGSLDKYIFGEEDTLDWDRTYSIACDKASALVYIHEDWHQRVVHRDVKASNVMLDSNFNAKLGDFGLARPLERDQVASHTIVVAGTLGYLAPECVMTGKATPEADVYSFGAVALEIACGRWPVDRSLGEDNCRLVEWVWDLYGQGKLSDAADGKLRGNFNEKEMERLMLVGLLCSHPNRTSYNERGVKDIKKGSRIAICSSRFASSCVQSTSSSWCDISLVDVVNTTLLPCE